MDAIATQLSVSTATISGDLVNYSTTEKSKPIKTVKNPKGAGRPKGSKKAPRPHYKATEIIARADEGLTRAEIAAETGVGKRQVRHVVEREQIRREAVPDITAEMLPMTARQKLDAAIRQYKAKLDAEFEMRTREQCRRWLNEISLPQYAKELAELERSITNSKGIMNQATYKKIRACLHVERLIQLLGIPLSQLDANLLRRYNEAFQLFNDLEKRVLDEKESPTQFRKMPKTYEELMAMKAKVQAERRAKRAAMVRK